VSDVFEALSSPTRRRILEILQTGERPAGELVASLPSLPQPAVSRHLKVLRQAGLVKMSPRGQQRIYALRPERLREVDLWISHYRAFWTDRLDMLERALDDETGAGRKSAKKGGRSP